MICPKCKGPCVVVDTVNNDPGNETMRERACKNCGNVFYTVEFVAYRDRQFLEDWKKYYRKRKKKKVKERV